MVCTKCINHPMFQMLLDEAKEFKYIIAGLLKLPYSVELLQRDTAELLELFQRLLCEVVQDRMLGKDGCPLAAWLCQSEVLFTVGACNEITQERVATTRLLLVRRAGCNRWRKDASGGRLQIDEEEELALAKLNGVTDTLKEDKRLDGWLPRERKKHERSSRGGARVLRPEGCFSALACFARMATPWQRRGTGLGEKVLSHRSVVEEELQSMQFREQQQRAVTTRLLLVRRRADYNWCRSQHSGEFDYRKDDGKMRSMVDFRVKENILADVTINEEEELISVILNDFTDTLEEDRKKGRSAKDRQEEQESCSLL
ncbi:hypothetical protein MUK42_18415 [Musa troglodytarum]|uniref:Uncharacterized protein n=1 Tax=Musa troglodytarum TaxID=320322 RepID=A0A9E7G126_9LILI|nr:hypothetical protein MUK42_18415 [Musa troglodytarum]